MRGAIVHRALRDFSRAFPDVLPADIGCSPASPMRISPSSTARPWVKAFGAATAAFARWFAATEARRRDGIARIFD
jgi:hypothetical protein